MITLRWLLLFALTIPLLATAEADQEGLLSWLPPRPDINNYSDRSDFIGDVLLWEKRKQHIALLIEQGELPQQRTSLPVAHDWHHVSGPEDLNIALHNAAGYKQPHYQEKHRFNRTTHISFPLAPLAAEQMANKRVPPAISTAPLPSHMEMQTLVTVDDSGHLVLAPPAPAIEPVKTPTP